MFGRIPEGQLLDATIVATDKVKRRHNYAELNHADDEELKRRGIERIEPKPACHSVDCQPAHYIQEEIHQCRRPFLADEMRPQIGDAEATTGASRLADACCVLLLKLKDALGDRLRFFAVRHEARQLY